MNREQVWKNFDLGQELSIAGTFLYNGLRRFHEMGTLENTDEVFEFLYDLSVGLERLLKIAIIMLEHDSSTDSGAFEASLITHNHLDLLARVRLHVGLPTGPEHNRLLALLSTFYKTFRYDRYSLAIGWEPDKELYALRDLLAANLQVSFPSKDRLVAIENTPRFRKHIGSLVRHLTTKLFDIVRAAADRLNLYTYELRHGSKAERIFLGNKLTFSNDDVLWKELLIYFVRTTDSSGMINFLRSFEPLNFDKGLAADYLACFASATNMAFVQGELDHLYSELPDPGDRLERLAVLGNPSASFPEDDEEEERWLREEAQNNTDDPPEGCHSRRWKE